MSSLKDLQQYGQSFWLDYIRRALITSGELERLVQEEGLRGLTSNLAIFQKVIAGSSDYEDALTELVRSNLKIKPRDLFEQLVIEDIRMAADILRPVYEETDGSDGFACLEWPPEFSHDWKRNPKEAIRLRKETDRPNIMVNIPATPDGIRVVEPLVSEGIPVNVTFIFSLAHYEAAAQAYLRGLMKCSTPHQAASVASFHISQVDTAIDRSLEALGTPEALGLRGKIAIANAKMAYKLFVETFKGERWEELEKRGARAQRLLWTSTGTKNPAYSDVLYAEQLIGPGTVIAMPPASVAAFRDHGRIHPTLEEDLEEAEASARKLDYLRVNFNAVAEKLQLEGLLSLAESFDSILSTLKENRRTTARICKDQVSLNAGEYKNQIEKRLESWKKQDFSRRLWSKDPTLWFPDPKPEIKDRLGWLVLPELMQERLSELISFAKQVKAEGITHAVLLGMGGSSLAPEIFQKTFNNAPGYPELVVLDSTHPEAVLAVEERLNFRRTLFLVSSKSGTTLETLSLFRYFWNKVSDAINKPGNHFVAITDPGTSLMRVAEERGFRRAFLSNPDVGGRYSAFSDFGLVPAALIGVDIHRLLDRAWIASESCAFCVSEEKAPGLLLGAALGEIGSSRDKITFLASPSLQRFPDWLEQLIAESTGKDGKGLVPIVNEPLISPQSYGHDRFFIGLFLKGDKAEGLEKRMNDIAKAGHLTVRFNFKDRFDLGRDMYCWEVAIAAAGSVIGIHPFNQPDVQLSKDFTRTAMERFTEGQEGYDEETFSIEKSKDLTVALKNWMGQAQNGDYIALQAYLSPKPETTAALQEIRFEILKRTKLATSLGYGPRFLHSTGQLHKGGTDNGLFLQIVDEPKAALPIPETSYDFRNLIRAQSLGDFKALQQRRRRVLRVSLRTATGAGLKTLKALIRDLG